MPELPEVETVRRTLLPHLLGRRITAVAVREPRLRWPVQVPALTQATVGATVRAVRRRAKYVLVDLAQAHGPQVLMVHLGMSGRLGVVPTGRPLQLHNHLSFELDDGRALRLNNPRRFGMVEAFAAGDEAQHPRLVHLGVEPLDAAACSAAGLFAASRGLKRPIKTFLMDAQQVVGIGNIYACEALHSAGIHPRRPAGGLSLQRWTLLVAAFCRTLTDAIEVGGTTLRDFANVEGTAGLFAPRLAVYGRAGAPCGRCGRPIRRLVQTGRSTFYCPGCQH